MRKIILTFSSLVILFLFSGCNFNLTKFTNFSPKENDQTVKDSEIVKIGNQIWMAKNINFGVMINTKQKQSDNNSIEKYCYNNNKANCDKYGGLYIWDEAMQYSNKKGARGICPKGFHIPTDAEWHVLEQYLANPEEKCDPNRGNTSDSESNSLVGCEDAGTALLPGGSSGFNATIGGYCSYYAINDAGSNCLTLDIFGSYWTSSEYNNSKATKRGFTSDKFPSMEKGIDRGYSDKRDGISVRCIKD